MKRLIPFILAILIAVPLGLELILRVFDPIGLWHIAYDNQQLSQAAQETPEGYLIKQGRYNLAGGTTTFLTGGARFVPATNPLASCKIVFIGDSFTQGNGVNDDETFVNQVALLNPNVNFVNAGRSAYNAAQVVALYQGLQADGFIYLYIGNDWYRPATYAKMTENAPHRSVLMLYIDYLRPSTDSSYGDYWAGIPYNNEAYLQAMLTFANDTHVLKFTLNDGSYGSKVGRDYSTFITIPAYHQNHHLSQVDEHPNALGHVLIAQDMNPFIQAWLANRCEGKL